MCEAFRALAIKELFIFFHPDLIRHCSGSLNCYLSPENVSYYSSAPHPLSRRTSHSFHPFRGRRAHDLSKMSAISRIGPSVAKNVLIHQQARLMASASNGSDPIQRLFLEKIRDFKSSNKGLDDSHKKLLDEEMARLKRVYRVEDENKLSNLEHKFESEYNVSLYDIDSAKELRRMIQSGEYQKKLTSAPKPKSELIASMPEPSPDDGFHLPAINKPDPAMMLQNAAVPEPTKLSGSQPDYEYVGPSTVTPAQVEREFLVKFADDMPTIHDDKSPQRDTVNFPRQNPLLDTPPTRHHIVPESWFQFFYPKTGVTGPYLFAGGLTTFLLSKEWLVMEHELLTAMSSFCIFAYAIPKYGPKVKEWLVNGVNKELDGWDRWQKGNAETLGSAIDHYKKTLASGNIIDELYQARKQEVDLQLEAEYRLRLKRVYDDARRRLDYLVSVAESQRQIHHQNMVNWVISNVHSSFGQKQENEVLDNCISSLKNLASKNANAI